MSIGVLHGQNGGAGLAVKVVGGTQKPSNAKQGVIWVNTDQKITSWTLQAEEPTEPTEGMVWIAIITNSRLNALKKNGIWFTPTSAKQYSDGGWVKKTGEYYNNDQWVALFEATIHITYPAGSVCTATDGVTTLTAPDTSGTWACAVPNAGTWTVKLNTGFYEVIDVVSGEDYTIDKWYLFKDGINYTNLTGGWSANGWTSSSPISEGILSTDRIKIYGVDGKDSVLATNSKIRLSGFTSLCISANVISTYSNNAALIVGVHSAIGGIYANISASVASKGTGNQTLKIPVSALDDGYIALKCGGVPNYKTDVFRIWLE